MSAAEHEFDDMPELVEESDDEGDSAAAEAAVAAEVPGNEPLDRPELFRSEDEDEMWRDLPELVAESDDEDEDLPPGNAGGGLGAQAIPGPGRGERLTRPAGAGPGQTASEAAGHTDEQRLYLEETLRLFVPDGELPRRAVAGEEQQDGGLDRPDACGPLECAEADASRRHGGAKESRLPGIPGGGPRSSGTSLTEKLADLGPGGGPEPPLRVPGPGLPGEPVQVLQFGLRLFIGCDPSSCSLTCDKTHHGTDFDGVIARWAVPHFGQKPAGSAWNALALCLLRHMATRNPASGELRGASVRTGNGVVWVDDFCLWTVVPWHPACGGLVGGCGVCLEYLPHSERLDADWQELCADLGVPLSAEKHKRSSQRPAYAGFDFDTVRGVVLTQPEKLEKLLSCIEQWRSASDVTPRELDGVQGRLMHYSFAIRHLRVVATQVFCLLGVVPEALYDVRVEVGKDMRELADEAELVVRMFHASGRPLWPRVASSLLREFAKGPVEGGLSFTLTWDASPRGWAALLRWWSSLLSGGEMREQLLIGTWPEGEDVAEQLRIAKP